jgi:hypothetical protein
MSFEQTVAPALALLDDGGPRYATPAPWPGHQARMAATLRKLVAAEVRGTPSWPRSWANSSLL